MLTDFTRNKKNRAQFLASDRLKTVDLPGRRGFVEDRAIHLRTH